MQIAYEREKQEKLSRSEAIKRDLEQLESLAEHAYYQGHFENDNEPTQNEQAYYDGLDTFEDCK